MVDGSAGQTRFGGSSWLLPCSAAWMAALSDDLALAPMFVEVGSVARLRKATGTYSQAAIVFNASIVERGSTRLAHRLLRDLRAKLNRCGYLLIWKPSDAKTGDRTIVANVITTWRKAPGLKVRFTSSILISASLASRRLRCMFCKRVIVRVRSLSSTICFACKFEADKASCTFLMPSSERAMLTVADVSDHSTVVIGLRMPRTG